MPVYFRFPVLSAFPDFAHGSWAWVGIQINWRIYKLHTLAPTGSGLLGVGKVGEFSFLTGSRYVELGTIFEKRCPNYLWHVTVETCYNLLQMDSSYSPVRSDPVNWGPSGIIIQLFLSGMKQRARDGYTGQRIKVKKFLELENGVKKQNRKDSKALVSSTVI